MMSTTALLHDHATRKATSPMDYQTLTPERQRELWQNALATFEEQHYVAVMNIAVAVNAATREKCAKDAAALVKQIAEARAQLEAMRPVAEEPTGPHALAAAD